MPSVKNKTHSQTHRSKKSQDLYETIVSAVHRQQRKKLREMAMHKQKVNKIQGQINGQFYDAICAEPEPPCALSYQILGSKNRRRQLEVGQTAACTAGVLNTLKTAAANQTRLLIDSGSTVTVVRDRAMFKTWIPSTMGVSDVGGRVHNATGRGNVELVVETTRGPRLIQFTDCVCIPSFAADIISTRRLRRLDGYDIRLPPDTAGYMIARDNTRITFRQLTDGLEYLEITNPKKGQIYLKTYATSAAAKPFSAWLSAASQKEMQGRVLEPYPDDKAYHVGKIRERLATTGIYMPNPATAATDELMRLHVLSGHANVRVVASYAHNYLSSQAKRKLGRAAELFCKHCARTKI